MSCPRVEQRIECPECGYPYSEAAIGLWRYENGRKVYLENDPGHSDGYTLQGYPGSMRNDKGEPKA